MSCLTRENILQWTKKLGYFQGILDCPWFVWRQNNSQSHVDVIYLFFSWNTKQSVFSLLIKRCIKINDNVNTQNDTFPLSYFFFFFLPEGSEFSSVSIKCLRPSLVNHLYCVVLKWLNSCSVQGQPSHLPGSHVFHKSSNVYGFPSI